MTLHRLEHVLPNARWLKQPIDEFMKTVLLRMRQGRSSKKLSNETHQSGSVPTGSD